ncbi:MAG: hypothetical protein U0T32_05710 [Chitinophagales bacterium]
MPILTLAGTVIWSGGDLPTPVSGTAINVAPTTSQTHTGLDKWYMYRNRPGKIDCYSCLQGKQIHLALNGSINGIVTIGTSLVFTYFKDGFVLSDGKSV